jgi:hypothetical protein
MLKKYLTSIFLAACSLYASAAQAELQTWRLTATIYNQSADFTPPPFAQIGQRVNIDYVIDTAAPFANSAYNGAVISATFNGQTSQTSGYLLAIPGLNAVNTYLYDRADGVDFVSFNRFGARQTHSLFEVLNDLSGASHTSSTDLRFDFGENSVSAHPESFAISAVPEPSSIALLGLGLSVIAFAARKNRRRQPV